MATFRQSQLDEILNYDRSMNRVILDRTIAQVTHFNDEKAHPRNRDIKFEALLGQLIDKLKATIAEALQSLTAKQYPSINLVNFDRLMTQEDGDDGVEGAPPPNEEAGHGATPGNIHPVVNVQLGKGRPHLGIGRHFLKHAPKKVRKVGGANEGEEETMGVAPDAKSEAQFTKTVENSIYDIVGQYNGIVDKLIEATQQNGIYKNQRNASASMIQTYADILKGLKEPLQHFLSEAALVRKPDTASLFNMIARMIDLIDYSPPFQKVDIVGFRQGKPDYQALTNDIVAGDWNEMISIYNSFLKKIDFDINKMKKNNVYLRNTIRYQDPGKVRQVLKDHREKFDLAQELKGIIKKKIDDAILYQAEGLPFAVGQYDAEFAKMIKDISASANSSFKLRVAKAKETYEVPGEDEEDETGNVVRGEPYRYKRDVLASYFKSEGKDPFIGKSAAEVREELRKGLVDAVNKVVPKVLALKRKQEGSDEIFDDEHQAMINSLMGEVSRLNSVTASLVSEFEGMPKIYSDTVEQMKLALDHAQSELEKLSENKYVKEAGEEEDETQLTPETIQQMIDDGNEMALQHISASLGLPITDDDGNDLGLTTLGKAIVEHLRSMKGKGKPRRKEESESEEEESESESEEHEGGMMSSKDNPLHKRMAEARKDKEVVNPLPKLMAEARKDKESINPLPKLMAEARKEKVSVNPLNKKDGKGKPLADYLGAKQQVQYNSMGRPISNDDKIRGEEIKMVKKFNNNVPIQTNPVGSLYPFYAKSEESKYDMVNQIAYENSKDRPVKNARGADVSLLQGPIGGPTTEKATPIKKTKSSRTVKTPQEALQDVLNGGAKNGALRKVVFDDEENDMFDEDMGAQNGFIPEDKDDKFKFPEVKKKGVPSKGRK